MLHHKRAHLLSKSKKTERKPPQHITLQLIKIYCGDSVIGYLYNFLWRGTVYCYQSGFRYSTAEAKLKPGLVCHSLAIDYNRENGRSVYNFLAGDSRYKRSMSTDTHKLTWLILQRRRLRFRFENAMLKIWRGK